jgi:hypothetical protein
MTHRTPRLGKLVAAALAAATLSACGQTVQGAPVQALPGDVVDAATVNRILGVPLANSTVDDSPPDRIDVAPSSCVVAAGPSTTAVYDDGWTRYQLVTMQEAPDYWDHSVTQTVGHYDTTREASKVFEALTSGLKDCSGEVTSTDALDEVQSTWTFDVTDSADDTVTWTATQTDADSEWACFRQARLTGSSVVQVAVCQVGNGAPAASQLADELVKKNA